MQKFATAAPVLAVVEIPAGRIQFIAADRADTTVEVRPANASKSRDVKAAEQVTAGYDDGVLRVEAAPAKNRLLGGSGAVEVTVQVPAGSRVAAKAAAAEFRGVGRLGDVAFEGGSGQVKIDEAASVRLTGLDADITVGRLAGSGEISTMQGDLTVTEAHGGTLTLSTQQGSVTVVAAPGVSAALDAGTTLGRVVNSLRNSGGTPELTIKATTQQGDISARSL
ncbi:DUF4097 family beta strand repeat-containing protein [Streptomyces sp. NPDC049813]|uniref:DUF4097 family beta strand repeat-containing protein n=1 Tax=Streptomyces sp. NPDC049813 TaxID=3365597 RepID=UPI00378A5495